MSILVSAAYLAALNGTLFCVWSVRIDY